MNTEHNPISGMLETAIGKIKDVIGSDVAIGKAFELPNGGTAIPVCKISFGFGTAGADVPKADNGFGGGLAGGINVTPIAFLVATEKGVRILQLDTIGTTADNIVRTVPEVVDKISGLFNKDGKGD